ncbi:MAG: hypothetical protein ED555_06745 [Allomuricauda sp.]|nr:MAG: hypothetical protein ED555_06745 [Allomuricauda sp.]
MILDLIESQGETARTLNFDKWFARFQDFGQDSNDPLVDLYAYDFLSDRSSETHQHYLKDLSQSNYYDDLRLSLVEKYPGAAFTNQYDKELHADRTLAAESLAEDAEFNWGLLLLKLAIVGLALGAIGYYLVWKKRNPYAAALKQLSPREKLIFDAIKNGKTNKEISAALFISHSTVKTHINNIYKKLGVTSREEIR